MCRLPVPGNVLLQVHVLDMPCMFGLFCIVTACNVNVAAAAADFFIFSLIPCSLSWHFLVSPSLRRRTSDPGSPSRLFSPLRTTRGILVVVVLSRNQVRGHRTGSSHSGGSYHVPEVVLMVRHPRGSYIVLPWLSLGRGHTGN